MSLPKCKDFTDYNKYPGEDNPTTDAQMQEYMDNQNQLMKAASAMMWQPSSEYEVGDIVISPAMPANTEAVCMVAGMTDTVLEPSWTMGSNIPDGSCFWKLRYVHYTSFLATEEEAAAGTDTEKIMTPALVKKAVENMNAATATQLKTARKINGITFDGSADITIVNNIEQGGTGATNGIGARVNLELQRRSYRALADIGADYSMSLSNICEMLPSDSVITFYASAYSTSAQYLPSSPIPVGGLITIIKGWDAGVPVQLILTQQGGDGDVYLARYTSVENIGLSAWKKIANNAALSVPSTSSITLSNTITSYTSPADGWINFNATGTSDNSYIVFVGRLNVTYRVGNAGVIRGFIPVSKGETVSISRNTMTVNSLKFVYAKSEV